MGIAPADLLAASLPGGAVPTFPQYVPLVRQAVGDGTRRVYGSYWNRILDRWRDRRLDEITATDVKQLVEHTKTHVVARRNNRGGRSAAEHLVAALRCLYRHAEDDGLVDPSGNPTRKVAKPRRLPSTRQAVPDDRLVEIHHTAATTGDDPALDTLLLRLHAETACRRGGALALRSQVISVRANGDRLVGESGPLAEELYAANTPPMHGFAAKEPVAERVVTVRIGDDELRVERRGDVWSLLTLMECSDSCDGIAETPVKCTLWQGDQFACPLRAFCTCEGWF